MPTLWEYLTGKRKALAARRPSGPRADDGLPLGIKIGTLVSFDPAPIVLAKAAGSLIEQPADNLPVAAWGRISYDGRTIHRFYLEGGQYMLQLSVEGDGKVSEEIFLYHLVQEIRPQSSDDWATWLADPDKPGDTGEIGTAKFDMLDPRDMSKVLASYRREWPDDSGNPSQVKPEEFSELLRVSPYGGTSDRVRNQVMLYGRALPKPANYPAGLDDPEEWLLLSASEFPGDAVVQMQVGIPVQEEGIRVVLS